ncbi:hypothetical protein [Streptomyces atriruber]|uniref:hypothetical protein n=1 Tax=Streptomyces atriruber TaxID=545121 RepID=UPI0006E2D1D0|nr:hypothetical protein [Streptomyces atriruber]
MTIRDRTAFWLLGTAHWLAGRHLYLSTGCQHGDHEYCQTEARRYDGTVKIPGQCKFCQSLCICRCHSERAER